LQSFTQPQSLFQPGIKLAPLTLVAQITYFPVMSKHAGIQHMIFLLLPSTIDDITTNKTLKLPHYELDDKD
jgi:hypothetical protein